MRLGSKLRLLLINHEKNRRSSPTCAGAYGGAIYWVTEPKSRRHQPKATATTDSDGVLMPEPTHGGLKSLLIVSKSKAVHSRPSQAKDSALLSSY